MRRIVLTLTILLIFALLILGALCLLFGGDPAWKQVLTIAGGSVICLLGIIGFICFARCARERCEPADADYGNSVLPPHQRNRSAGSAGTSLRTGPAATREVQTRPGSQDSFELLAATLAAGKKKSAPEAPAPDEVNAADGQREATGAAAGDAAQNDDDLRRRLVVRREEISLLLRRSREYLEPIDDYMLKHLTRNTAGSIQAVVDIRRIVAALEIRLREIEDFLSAGEAADPAHGDFLLNGALEVGQDSLNNLISQQPIGPLKPVDWSPILKQLFARIGRRRSIFKALKIKHLE